MTLDDVKAAKYCMEHDAFAQLLGTEVVELEPGYARTQLKISEEMLNFVKIPHGAVVFAVADQAFAAAANARGQIAVALNVSITFIAAAALNSTLIAEAREIHCGRRTATYHVIVWDDQGNTIASFQGVVYRKEAPITQVVEDSMNQ